ncbi:hypothetical protein [Paraburkholderia sp. MM6662-R1]|uniref:hypothetical protein n=1 Tax=Paraburkholderia sp. MM6662-R1 TaxID=2991066 RepID=UPI003D1E09BC
MTLDTLHAGRVNEIHRASGTWVFVDPGFSRASQTSGLLVQNAEPTLHTFAQLCESVSALARQPDGALNLVLEAPLSAAFTADGNPAGRRMEKRGNLHRYWYAGLGCQVTLAAAHLLRAVIEAGPARDIRLFEAFVSFKAPGVPSDHAGDVRALRDVVWNAHRAPGAIVSPDALPGPHAAHVESAFRVFGFDPGVPPVIVADPL